MSNPVMRFFVIQTSPNAVDGGVAFSNYSLFQCVEYALSMQEDLPDYNAYIEVRIDDYSVCTCWIQGDLLDGTDEEIGTYLMNKGYGSETINQLVEFYNHEADKIINGDILEPRKPANTTKTPEKHIHTKVFNWDITPRFSFERFCIYRMYGQSFEQAIHYIASQDNNSIIHIVITRRNFFTHRPLQASIIYHEVLYY